MNTVGKGYGTLRRCQYDLLFAYEKGFLALVSIWLKHTATDHTWVHPFFVH